MTARNPFNNLPDENAFPTRRRQGGMRPIARRWEPCRHPEHQPPSMLHIPAGHEYVHVCPGCGAEMILRGSDATLAVAGGERGTWRL